MNAQKIAALAAEQLAYDPSTGDFRWLVSKKGPGAKAGAVAGWRNRDGYVCIKLGQHKVFAHRLAWLVTRGSWPEHFIDHIDGNPSNNRIVNLRDVPQALNIHNVRRDKSGKTSGLPRGVKKNGNGFAARIRSGGKSLHIGQFATIGEASTAYQAARARLHAGFVE